MLGTILGIVWFIIKILLWIILGILGLLLALILMVLLVPLRYEVAGSKYEELQGRAKISYLFSFLRVYVHYEPKGYWYKVKVLFFTVAKENTMVDDKEKTPSTSSEKRNNKNGEKKASDDKEDKVIPTADKGAAETPKAVEGISKGEAAEQIESTKEEVVLKKSEVKNTTAEEPAAEKVKLAHKASDGQVIKTVKVTDIQGSQESPDQKKIKEPDENVEVSGKSTSVEVKETPKRNEGSKKKSGKKKIGKKKEKSEGLSGMDQVKIMWSFLREDRNVGVLRFILKKIFKAIGSVLPKKFKAKIHIGLEDPATTGYIVGSAAAFYHKWGDSLQVTGDFENQVFEGEVDIKGRIIPGIFVWAAIRLYLDGRVRRLIKQVRQLS